MTETELLAHVLDDADELDVLAFHDPDSRCADGDPGFPDLILLGQTLEIWELKSATGRPSAAQALWHRRFRAAGITVRIVQPDQWPGEVRAWLRNIRGQ